MAATATHETRYEPAIRKLPKLPKNARVTKRPLQHPAIPSPFSGASNPKVVYVSAKTPFLSAVKRVEKLLKLADKRLVQSATTTAQSNKHQRKRGRNDGYDEIGEVAAEVERVKRKRRRINDGHNRVADGPDVLTDDGMEEVVLKATGKAIQRGLELGEWFRKREDEYAVKIKTGSVKAIDDVEIPEGQDGQSIPNPGHVDSEDSQIASLPGGTNGKPLGLDVNDHKTPATPKDTGGLEVDIPETRTRYVSVLEIRVSLL